MIVRKKPETFDAWQFSGHLDKAPAWIEAEVVELWGKLPEMRRALVKTPKGTLVADPSDWIVGAADGEIAIVPASDFARDYEPA